MGSLVQIEASRKSYGPDGPWQAISMNYGDPPQELDVYPICHGGIARVLSTEVCEGVTVKPCGSGGLLNTSTSPGRNLTGPGLEFSVDSTSGALNIQGKGSFRQERREYPGLNNAVPNYSMQILSNVSMIYPDGNSYPLQLGEYAFGGCYSNGSFSPRASFGMHIGSAAFNLPPSVWTGGYDSSRVIGPISSQSVLNTPGLAIDLLDIGIEVEYGGSPFSYLGRSGILAADNSSLEGGVQVLIKPAAPYLNLPNSTCAAIAKDLPVTYQPKYGLYFWNVNDPQYQRILMSPSYLSFIFRSSESRFATLTVKVPFQLLNLTLDRPLIEIPTPYFPCQPPLNSYDYSLGRAFLQAAFLGGDCSQLSGRWFLAQAPGPDIPSIPTVDKYPADLNFSNVANNWVGTWSSVWTPLPDTADDNNKKNFTVGAKVGISIACLVILATLIGLSIFFFRRSRRLKRSTAPVLVKQEEQYALTSSLTPQVSSKKIREMPIREPQELSSNRIYEMPFHEAQELHS